MSVPVTNLPTLTPEIRAFVEKTTEDAKLAFKVFRETGTTTAQGTVGFVERVPNEEKLVIVNYPGPFNPGKEVTPTVVGVHQCITTHRPRALVVIGNHQADSD